MSNRDGNQFGQWDNVHECPVCGGTRQFCENCHADHHAGGWENCSPNIQQQD